MKKLCYTTSLFFLLLNLTLAQPLDSLITEGDQHYNSFQNEKALEVFQKADSLYPDNWEVLWRLSRTYTDIAEHMPSSTDEQVDEQLATYEQAVEYADKAIQLAPDQAVTYLRRAIANGRIALFKGVFSVGGVVNQVRDDTHKAIELGNGGNEVQGVAHYVLARTHDKISDKWKPARSVLGLGWADYDSAIVHFDKAVKLYPGFIMIYLDYAKALIEEDQWEEAKELLEKAINSPIKDEDDEQRIVEAKELLEKVNEEL